MTDARTVPWLVLRTRSRHESSVENCLQQKQITAYLPKRREIRRWKGKKKLVEMPLFPGYVFVRPHAEQYETMRYIRGSCGLVLAGSQPATMAESELEAVKILVDSGVTLAVVHELIPGQKVKVVSGPLAGAQGELVRVKCGERLVINAQVLNSSVSVEVGADMIVVI